MKFLANENLPVQSLRILRQKGFEIVSVAEVSAGLRDEEVLKLAKTESRIILTFDRDFGELVFRKGGEAKGIILLRFAPRSPEGKRSYLRGEIRSSYRKPHSCYFPNEKKVRVAILHYAPR